MASTFNLEVVTPDRKFFEGEVEMVIFMSTDGEVGILKNHAPMVIAVAIGPLKIKKDEKWTEAVINEGFMEVKNNRVVILTDTAEWPDEIDINRATAAKQRAEERLHRKLGQVEYTRSQAALSRALARLSVKNGTEE